jgi:hypothetical protein
MMPAQGTPVRLILIVKAGACLDMPKLRNTRPVANRPEFRLDIAAMINTPWTRPPIHDKPIAPNTVTNGLIPET